MTWSMMFWLWLPALFFSREPSVSPAGRQALPKLSDYGFFELPLNRLEPRPGTIPYDLNTPLFSDYAHKARFLHLPKGEKAKYHPERHFDFPSGTILIKNFYYPVDFRKPDKGRRIIETRLLIRDQDGWTAWPYVWNDQQTDAYLEVAGESTQVKWIDESGKKKKLNYLIPSTNQCKGCHTNTGKLQPIGPAARHLNKEFNYSHGTRSQLQYWKELDILKDLPATNEIPANAVWDQPASGSLEMRARAWLDVNCGHCHSPGGSGSTSGLLLDISQQEPSKIGVMKPPVAAGRGSGNLDFDIVPGEPDKSILVFRMESNDLGIRMPEIGRNLPDKEGIDLIKQWIREMKP